MSAPGGFYAAQVLGREPWQWAGRERPAAQARRSAEVVPALPGVDLVLSTDGRSAEAVAGVLLANCGWVGR